MVIDMEKDILPIFPDKTGALIWKDIREFKLKYNIPLGKISRFFEGLKEGVIYATKCKRCGKIYFPPQADCPYCRTSDVEWIKLSGEGKLLTFSIINVKPTTFSHYQDYAIGICELKEGVRIFTWIRTNEPNKLKVGMKIKIKVVKREPEGYLIYEGFPEE